MAFERWLRVARLRVTSLFRRSRLERDLAEELSFHIERETDALVAAGMPLDEARRRAVRAMPRAQRIEECRDATGLRLLHDLVQDGRGAVRSIVRAPSFAAVAIAAMTLGIGANTAAFSVVHSVLVRPLPFPAPDRLMTLAASPGGSWTAVTERHFLDYRNRTTAFDGVATVLTETAAIALRDNPVTAPVARVTTEFFEVLGVPPALGRTFTRDELTASGGLVAVVSDKFWRSQLAADAAVIGRTLTIGGRQHTIVGVMPAGFLFLNDFDAWTPFEPRILQGTSMARPTFGRLKTGVTPAQAESEFAAAVHATAPDWVARVSPLRDWIVGDSTRALVLFAGVVGLVLLIACANVANLFLARVTSRDRELSVRAALGAGRGRLVRQLLTESCVLALAGGACGVALALVLVPAFVALAPAGVLARADEIDVSPVALLFTMGVSVGSGLLFGLAPAGTIWRRVAGPPSARSATHAHDRTRNILIVAEVALSFLLVAGAGLLLNSLVRLHRVDPGFDTVGVVTMTIALPDATYTDAGQMRAFHDRMLAGIHQVPGVAGAGAINWVPLGGNLITGDFTLEGGRSLPDGYDVAKCTTSPGYFEAMGIGVTAGRDFTGDDGLDAPGVAIVTEAVAHDVWPGEPALGKRLSVGRTSSGPTWLTVVGVVEDVRQQGLQQPLQRTIYQPYTQVTQPFGLSTMTFVMRSTLDAGSLAGALRPVVRAADPDVPIPSLIGMDTMLLRETAHTRFYTRLIGTFATIALALTLVGIYGVLSYTISLRTREFGIRLALGAKQADIMRNVIAHVARLGAAGVAVGLVLATFLSRSLSRFLFEVAPADPVTLAAAGLVLLAAAVAAASAPAWRATRVAPTVALRAE